MSQEQVNRSENSKHSRARKEQQAEESRQAEEHDAEHISRAKEKGENLKDELIDELDAIDKNLEQHHEQLEKELKQSLGRNLMLLDTQRQLGHDAIHLVDVDRDVQFQQESGYRPGTSIGF